MLSNYYKTAVRNLSRSRLYAVINVAGLSIGIAFSMLIAVYCWKESQVNHLIRNPDRQYFLTSQWKTPNIGADITSIGPLAKALKDNYPSLVANFYRWDGITSAVSFGDRHFREGLQVGDSTLLPMYGFRLLYGDAGTALDHPFSVVITDEKAIKFFGRTDVVGQDLTIDNFSGAKHDFRITGVMEKPSHNSITWLNDANDNGIFIPSSNLSFFGRNMDWPNIYIASYVELQKGVSPEALDAPIAHLLKVNTNPFIQSNLKVLPRALKDYYLAANGGSVRKMIYTLTSIALFILVMAMINFINLSISRSTTRLKEIGIRKVLGSLRQQLRIQFLTESTVLAAVSTAIALLIYQLSAPFFSDMLGKAIPSLSQLPSIAWVLIPLFAICVGWLAGIYPAALLSSLSSVDALKSKVGTVKENVMLRKALVGFQFGTAAIVFIGAIIVSQQISLFFSDRLGYDKEYVVSAALPRDWSQKGVRHMSAVRDAMARIPEIREATLTYSIPNGMGFGSIGTYREGSDTAKAIAAEHMLTDEHYASTYRIPMAAGVFFNAPGESAATDSLGMVLNETAAKALGWQTPRDAIGQRMRLLGVADVFTVSGVVKDFHFNAMGAPIQPEVFTHLTRLPIYRYFSFKLKPGNIGEAMGTLQKQWAVLMPGAPFEYIFMDETLQTIYKGELRLRKAASAATVLAVIIALLGVAGLIANSVRRRAREIAVRKVIGASVPGIIRLFLREYLPVLFIAGLVASPVAYWIMNHWLDNYVTRITITIWPFIVAVGGLALLIVSIIVAQTVSAALANPVKSLRSE